MPTENDLKEKARRAFKGLDDDDYQILRYFWKEKGADKYSAKKFFEGKEPKKPRSQIPRSSFYKRVKVLKDKDFLEVVGHREFKRGSLEADMEILRSLTFKGAFAVLGSDIDPHEVFILPNPQETRKSAIMQKTASYEKMFEFYNNLLDSVIEMGEDLTDLKGKIFFHFTNTALMIKRPDYFENLMSSYTTNIDARKMIKELKQVSKYFERDMGRAR